MKNRADKISQFRGQPAIPQSAPLAATDPSAHRSQSGARLCRRSLSQCRERERIRVRLQICRAIDAHVAKGGAACAKIRELARRWSGSVFRCDPARRMNLSQETIKRVYWSKWLRSGRSAAALARKPDPAHLPFRLSPTQHQTMIQMLRGSGCTSWRALFREVFTGPAKPPSDYIFRRIFPRHERQRITAEFIARRLRVRTQRAAEASFTAWLQQADRSFASAGGEK